MTLPTMVFANNGLNLQLPSPYNSYSFDEIRTEQGSSCKNAVNGVNLELGMTGIVNNVGTPFQSNPDQTKDVGLYARINIPLDTQVERVNCNSLYQLELRKKRLEIIKLETELQRLKELKFENGKKD